MADDLEGLGAELAEQERQQALQSSAVAASGLSSDKAAQTRDLGQKHGLDPSLVDRNLDQVKKLDASQSNDHEALAKDYPALSDWLADPHNMAVAKDSIPHLKKLSDLHTEPPAEFGVLDYLREAGKALFHVDDFQDLEARKKESDAARAILKQTHPEAYRKIQEQRLVSGFAALTEEARREALEPIPFVEAPPPAIGGGTLAAVRATSFPFVLGGKTALGLTETGYATLKGRPPEFWSTMSDEWKKALAASHPELAREGVIEINPKEWHDQLAKDLYDAMGTNEQDAPAAKVFATELASRAAQLIPELLGSGMNPSYSGSKGFYFSTLGQQFKTPITGPKVETGIIPVTEAPPPAEGTEAAKNLAMAREHADRVVQSFTAGELGGLNGDPVKTANIIARKIFKQYGIEGQATVYTAESLNEMMSRGATESQKATQAVREAENLGEAGKTATDAPITQRSAAASHDVQQAVVADTPRENLYVDAKTWVAYFQAKGGDPIAEAKALGIDPGELAESLNSGAPMPVNRATYNVVIGATEHGKHFDQEVRAEPDAPNGREGKETLEEQKAEPPKRFLEPEATERLWGMAEEKGTPGISFETPVGELERRYPTKNAKMVVSRNEKGEVVGILQIPLDERTGQVAPPEWGVGPAVYVVPEARRQGVATTLYDFAEKSGYDLSKVTGMPGEVTEAGYKFTQARKAAKAVAEAQAGRQASSDLSAALRIGMAKEQAAALAKASAEAHQKAVDEVANQFIASEKRRETAAWKKEAREIRQNVEDDIRQQPVYRAIDQLRGKEEPTLKIDRNSLTDEERKGLPRGIFAKKAEGPTEEEIRTEAALVKQEWEESTAGEVYRDIWRFGIAPPPGGETLKGTKYSFRLLKEGGINVQEPGAMSPAAQVHLEGLLGPVETWKGVKTGKAFKALLEASRRPDFEAQAIERLARHPEGLPVDQVAEILGFPDTTSMLKALRENPPLRVAVEGAVEVEMQKRHPDGLSAPGELHEKAQEALASSKRAEVLRKELEYLLSEDFAKVKGLLQKLTGTIPSSDAIKAESAEAVKNLTIRDLGIRIRGYQGAQRRAAKAAMKAFTDGEKDKSRLQAVADHKTEELIAMERANAAIGARKTIREDLSNLKGYLKSKADLEKSRNMDLVYAARSVLADAGISTERQAETTATYLDQLSRYHPDVAADIQDALRSIHIPAGVITYKDLTVGQFHAIREEVEALWNMSRRVKQIEVKGKLKDMKEVSDKLKDAIPPAPPPPAPPGHASPGQPERTPTGAQKAASKLADYMATHRLMGSWALRMGPEWRELVFNPVHNAEIEARLRKETLWADQLARIESVKWNTDRIPATELRKAGEAPMEFRGDRELWMFMAHASNQSNLDMMILSDRFDPDAIEPFIQRMIQEGRWTEAHQNSLQATLDTFKELLPENQKVYKSLNGKYFKEIAGIERHMFGKVQPGGYFPRERDFARAKVSSIPQRDRDEILRKMREAQQEHAGRLMPSVDDRFTMERGMPFDAPLTLDINRVYAYLAKEANYIHLAQPVTDASKLLLGGEKLGGVRDAISAFEPSRIDGTIKPWLEHVATQTNFEKSTNQWFDNFLSGLQRNTNAQVIFLSGTEVMGRLFNSTHVFAEVRADHLLSSATRYAKNPSEAADFVNSNSPFMLERAQHWMRSIESKTKAIVGSEPFWEGYGMTLGKPRAMHTMDAFIQDWGPILQIGFHHATENVTWMGAFNQAMAKNGGDYEAAIKAADGAIEKLFGGQEQSMLATSQAGGALYKLFAAYSRYPNTKLNYARTEWQLAAGKSPAAKMARRANVAWWAYGAPAILLTWVMAAMFKQRPRKDETDEEFLARQAANRLSTSIVGGVPIVGPAVSWSMNALLFGRQPMANEPLTAPAAAQIAMGVQGAHEAISEAISDEQKRHHQGHDEKLIKEISTLIGLATGLPMKQAGKAAAYGMEVESGESDPEDPLDIVEGLISGSGKEKK